MCASMADIHFATAENRREKKKEKERKKKQKKKPQDENIMSVSATQGGHNNSVNSVFVVKRSAFYTAQCDSNNICWKSSITSI